jgi:DNA-binding transcriptional regulator YiaG
MKPDEFKALLKRLGLSLEDAAELLGVTTRSVRRWLDGTRKVPWPVVRFLDYLVATKVTGKAAISKLD